MSSKQCVGEVFEREFLPLRARILEIAAGLDRIGRAGSVGNDEPRVAQLHAGLEVLLSSESDRAEQVQLIFSRKYDENWRSASRVDKK